MLLSMFVHSPIYGMVPVLLKEIFYNKIYTEISFQRALCQKVEEEL
jgi:hypothetical protein